MVATKHEFLAELHRIIKPMTYLEIGVQHGYSLALANECRFSYGVDPDPQLRVPITGTVFQSTSDDFFVSKDAKTIGTIDLAFIDGMHLVEFALRDFMNLETRMDPWGVIIFDDVLPRNHGEANRTQCPGDWTGDVWKIHEIFYHYRPDLSLRLVDVQPTGLLVVGAANSRNFTLHWNYQEIIEVFTQDNPLPSGKFDDVLSRKYALAPDAALSLVRQRWQDY